LSDERVIAFFLLFSLSFEKESREKKRETKKKRDKENFIIKKWLLAYGW